MRFTIHTHELLELRNILQTSQKENACIACGLCCKISGKFFIQVEKNRLSNRFSSLLFMKEDDLDVIRTSDDLPWCLGAEDPLQVTNYANNERNILNPKLQIDDAPNKLCFHKVQ